MNPVNNPYSPGAGASPPELTGRDEIRETARIALARTLRCQPEKSLMFIGLRGVGKTVLLVDMQKQAKQTKVHTVFIESLETRSLPSVLVPQLRSALLAMSRGEKMRHALSVLAGFARAFKLKINIAGFGVEWQPGLADAGDLEHDLPMLMEAVGEAAKAENAAVAILIDELQYIGETGLSEEFVYILASHFATAFADTHRRCGFASTARATRQGKKFAESISADSINKTALDNIANGRRAIPRQACVECKNRYAANECLPHRRAMPKQAAADAHNPHFRSRIRLAQNRGDGVIFFAGSGHRAGLHPTPLSASVPPNYPQPLASYPESPPRNRQKAHSISPCAGL